MIVTHAHIQMGAQREYREQYHLQERLEVWVGPVEALSAPTPAELPELPEVDISRAGSLLAMYREQQVLDLEAELDPRSRLNLMILKATFEAISGQSLNLREPKAVAREAGQTTSSLNVDTPAPQRPVRMGSGVIYQRQERYQEREAMHFQSQGVVRTQDGREIQFQVDLGMSREFVQESNLEIRAGDAAKIDPLVINFDGQGAQLSQTRFAFDLDTDGTAEQIARLRPGSGYLALDRNGDGEISNGSELFGPSSGRGFAELAQFDEDGNQFIDEGDSIYHKLRIWQHNEDGTSQLAGLGDSRVGAIFLGHVSSSFQLKDADNNSLGEIANSGIYLKEDGGVGVVQELNLTV